MNKRIAILTYHKAFNCGAMLQAWALKAELEKNGCIVEFPACNKVGVVPRWISLPQLKDVRGFRKLKLWLSQLVINILSIGFEDYNRIAYRCFRCRYLPERNCRPEKFADFYDCAVVGSDQVWHPMISKTDTKLFLAESIPATFPVVSYAASYGDNSLMPDAFNRLTKALHRFKAISVREELACSELKGVGFKAEIVLDPTLLLEASEYRPLIGERLIRGKYLFLYAVSLSDFVLATARELAKRLGLKLVICGVYVRTKYRTPPECLWGISPEKMVTLIAHADAVLASSFHGTAFSVIFSKPFLSLRDSVDTHPTRISTLLESIGISDRIANPETDMETMVQRLNATVYWNEVHGKISELRQKSRKFLRGALEI